MPAAAPLFLKLIAAHVVGDFVLQSDRWAREKRKPAVLLGHLGVHALLLLGVAWSEPSRPVLWLALAWVVVGHGLIDAWSSRRNPGWSTLIADQVLHVASLGIAVALARSGELAALGKLGSELSRSGDAYLLVSGFAVAVFGGSVAVGRWVLPFGRAISESATVEWPGLERAGRLIGMFERAVIFIALLARMESLVGFVIAGKAILRLPEARESGSRTLAEYYLVGSLASLMWGVAVGVLVRRLVEGQP